MVNFAGTYPWTWKEYGLKDKLSYSFKNYREHLSIMDQIMIELTLSYTIHAPLKHNGHTGIYQEDTQEVISFFFYNCSKYQTLLECMLHLRPKTPLGVFRKKCDNLLVETDIFFHFRGLI